MGDMTSVEIARRSTRHLSQKDPSQMDPSQKLQLVDAINAGLYQYFEKADDQYRRTTATELLLAPVMRNVVTTKHSETLSGAPFLTSERGRAILIDGDPHLNEIVGVNQLLRPYRGDSGTYTATIYSDVINIRNFQVERLAGDPILIDTGEELINKNFDLIANRRQNQVYHSFASLPLGDPRYYSHFYVGGSISTGSDDSAMMVKLDPIPARELVIQFDIIINATALTIDSIREPVLIPIDATKFARQFLPLIEENLMLSPMWIADSRTDEKIYKAADEARESIEKMTHVFTRPKRRVGTKRGY